MFCPNCGKEVADGTKFCGNCGAKIEQPDASPKQEPVQPPVPPVTPVPPVQPQVTMQQPVTEANMPSQYRPLNPWAYFGYTLLFSIPVVGFILLIVFSFKRSNINRRNFARSYWCMLLVCVILLVVLVIVAAATGSFERLWYQIQAGF